MAFIGYFFLMRSGEYTGLPHAEDIHQFSLFRLQDVQLWIGTQRLLHLQCPLADLALATFASLTLPTKKVAFVVKLSVTSAADTSMPALSGLLRSESFICANTMPIPPPTPLLNGRHHNHRWTYIMATNITVALCASAALIGSSLGFLPSDVSA